MWLLRLVRFPNLLIIMLTQVLVAYALQPEPEFAFLSDYKFWLMILGTVLVAAAGYIINDYMDVKLDMINKPDRVIIGKQLSRRQAIILHVALNIIAVGMAALVNWKLIVVNFISALLLWRYSSRFKKTPLAGNLLIALLCAASIFMVWFWNKELNLFLVIAYSAFGFFITWIRELVKDLEDMRGDARYRCRTLPLVIGIRPAKRVAFGLMAVLFFGVALFAVLQPYTSNILWKQGLIIWLFATVMVPLVRAARLLHTADVRKQYSRVSRLCKFIMLGGILSLFFF